MIATVTGVALFGLLVLSVSLPREDAAHPAPELRNQIYLFYLIVAAVAGGWLVGVAHDFITEQGWFTPAAREARAVVKADWMGEPAARRRRLRIILLVLGVLLSVGTIALSVAP
jgi:hypothetical protein